MTSVLLPALQGQLGSWTYYAALMRLSDVESRISYAREIHKNSRLSDMIQRRLDDHTRAADIEHYLLQTEDRFFNSLVVGVYGGTPQWHPFEVNLRHKSHNLKNLPDSDRDAIGYLELDGRERLFALDGQHRLAGIRRALQKSKTLGDERVSVLFVPHVETPSGLRRTRSLFVAINKKAVPVSKRDIIALDEIDLAAIITRQIVDDVASFNQGQIDLDRFTPSIPAGAPGLTTIGNFYDVIKLALQEVVGIKNRPELVQAARTRLPDQRIAHYAKEVRGYLDSLVGLDPELKKALATKNFGPKIVAGRGPEDPRILFRPIGLSIFTRLMGQLCKSRSQAEAFKMLRRVPLEMSEAPFVDVIWDQKRNRMMTTNAPLCVGLLLYMLGAEPADRRLRERYALLKGVPVDKIRLPNKFKA